LPALVVVSLQPAVILFSIRIVSLSGGIMSGLFSRPVLSLLADCQAPMLHAPVVTAIVLLCCPHGMVSPSFSLWSPFHSLLLSLDGRGRVHQHQPARTLIGGGRPGDYIIISMLGGGNRGNRDSLTLRVS